MLHLATDVARSHATLHAASFGLRQSAFPRVFHPADHTCEALPATAKALYLLSPLGLWKIKCQFILFVTNVAAESGEIGRACLANHSLLVFARKVHAVPIKDSVAFITDVNILLPPPFARRAHLRLVASQRSTTARAASGTVATYRLSTTIDATNTSNRTARQNAMCVHQVVECSGSIVIEVLGNEGCARE